MLSWWRQRSERQQQVIRDAENLMALFGDQAYAESLRRARHEDETGGSPAGAAVTTAPMVV
jgi:hypothetical protein